MIAGFEIPTSGTVLVNGKDITFMPPQQRDTGMVFQAYALFPNMTVADNIGFGLRIARKPAGEIKQRVAEMLALIKMGNFGVRYPYQLSGGQQQRVALARALPFARRCSCSTSRSRRSTQKSACRCARKSGRFSASLGITTIYVTHDQEEALSISDRIVVMNEGRMEQVGTPFEIYNFPKTDFVAHFVGTLNAVKAQVRDAAAGLLTFAGQQVRTAQKLDTVRSGETTTISLRPERLGFAADGAKANVMDCTVENITFLGSIVRIQVKAGEQTLYMDTFNNPFLELPKLGDKTQITFSAEAVLVLDQTPVA